MRSCGSLSDTRTREIEDVGTVGSNVSTYQGIRLAFLRAEDLGTFEVGTTSTKFVPAIKVEKNLR